jgi:hypothetical protein
MDRSRLELAEPEQLIKATLVVTLQATVQMSLRLPAVEELAA